MPTITPSTSATVTVPAGLVLRGTGTGTATLGPGPRANQQIGLDADGWVIGPFEWGQVVYVTAAGAVTYEVQPLSPSLNVDETLRVESAISAGDAGFSPPDWRSPAEQAISEAMRLRGMTTAPTVVETAPTNRSNGNVYFIDGIAGNNGAAGNTPSAPWKDVYRLPGTPGAGATIYVAADATYEYAASWTDYKAGRVDATNSFSANNVGQWTGTSTNPIVFRPYYPRGVTSQKPRILWYALMQPGDWTQEAGISGGKVWSAAWSKGGNSYQNVGVCFGTARRMGVLWNQQNTSGDASLLTGPDQFAVSTTKVFVYVPDGSNPNTYYGEIRIFGGNTQALYTSYNGLCQNVKFIGIRFEMCMPFYFSSSAATANADNLEVSFCDFIKTTPSQFKHANTGTASEQVLSFHDNYCEDTHSAVFKLQSTGGTAGNTVSWEVYRNKVVRGNVSAGYGGALFYGQATAGTKHIAWGNYLYDCRTAPGNEPIDGCGMYADVGSDKAIFFGNVAERCGKLFQMNSMSGLGVAVANVAIDSGALCSVTNTTGDLKSPSVALAHNTYLWTGRVPFSVLSVGPNIGGTGVRDWSFEPAIEITNSQANTTGNTAYNFGTLSLANNAVINASGTQLANKKAARVPETWTTTLLVAGNASCGMAAQAITGVNSGADLTNTARYLHLIGAATDAVQWLPLGTSGIARPGADSLLIGRGAVLSVQYQDIAGRNFAAFPTIGCYEAAA